MPSEGVARRRGVFGALFVGVLLCSALLGAYRLDEPPWDTGHHGFVMTEYPHNALNYVRFGYRTTRLGLAMHYGDAPGDVGFAYRVDHGVLTSVLISFAYRLWGVHAWSARLVPLLAALTTAAFTALLALRLTDDRRVALLTLTFAALAPLTTFYARLPAPHNVAVLFCVLVFLSYWRWFETGRPGWLVGVFVALIAGVLTDWIAYFTVPAVLLHYLVFGRERRAWVVMATLALAPFLLFGLHLWWSYRLTRAVGLEDLLAAFLTRAGGGIGDGTTGGRWAMLLTFLDRALMWMTVPSVVLSGLWLVWAARVRDARHGLVGALFLFGVAHNLIFSNRVLVHEFIMLFHLIPAFAVASAWALVGLVNRVPASARGLRFLAGVVVLTLFLAQSAHGFVRAHRAGEIDVRPYDVGLALRAAIPPEGCFIDAADLYRHLGVLRAYVTADRAYERADTLDGFRTLQDTLGCEAVVVDPVRTDFALRAYLVERHPHSEVAGYAIFDLTRTGSDVVVSDPEIQHPYRIDFGGVIEYLGFDVEAVVDRRGRTIPWWQRYLVRHADRLPAYRSTVRVAHYWRCVDADAGALALDTQWGDRARAHPGLDALYPVSAWPVGQVVREEVTLALPADAATPDATLWVAVRDGERALAPRAPSDVVVDLQGRAAVARWTPEGHMVLYSPNPIVQAVDVTLADGMSLQRFVQSHRRLHPGDWLNVTLTWRARASISQNYKVFVHLLDGQGRLVAQHDGPPAGETTSAWEAGTSVVDVHPLALPADLSPGLYRVQVGMYDAVQLERLAVLESSAPAPDHAIRLGELEVSSWDE